MEYNELYHYGVKGMKWGVRRYQTKNGSLTPAGKKRYSEPGDKSERNKRIAKKVATMAIMGATVAAAAALYAKNPDAINKVVSKVGKTTVSSLKKTGNVYKIGKQYMKDVFDGTKEGLKEGFEETFKGFGGNTKTYAKTAVKQAAAGIKEGVKESVKEAPKKATKTIITGATLLAAKRMLDNSVGKEEAARIFQANNSKKISSFWKVSQEDKDDD